MARPYSRVPTFPTPTAFGETRNGCRRNYPRTGWSQTRTPGSDSLRRQAADSPRSDARESRTAPVCSARWRGGSAEWTGCASFDELRPGGRVVFGSGRLLAAADEARRLGGRIALIASASAARAADELVAALGASCVLRLDDVAPHVPVVAAREASERVAQARADALVSIGGGAATGLAKAVAHVHGTAHRRGADDVLGQRDDAGVGPHGGRRQGDRARPARAAGLRGLRPRVDAAPPARGVRRQRDERAGAGPGRGRRAGPGARHRLARTRGDPRTRRRPSRDRRRC